jgi:small subunit ribosomal protein S21
MVALRKFKKKVEDSNHLVNVIKRQEYEKPTTERKRKKSAAKARWMKKLSNESLPKKNY